MMLPPYPYCPACAQPLPQDSPYRQECRACGFILYHSSSPCMGAVPLDDQGSILLARRGIQPYFGGWNTIGGFLEYGEEPLEGLKREVEEETGVGCQILDFILMNADTYGPGGTALVNSYFTVRLLGSELQPQDDVSELRWFDLHNLPDNIPFSSDRRALAELKKKIGA